MSTNPSRYLVIEGLIGVGKTTLCRLLGERLDARLVLEPWEDNPFLASFYEDPTRYAFPAQMFYLATRYAQQQQIRQAELFTRTVISDYLFDKDHLFAEETLDGHFLELYERFAQLMAQGVPRPDVVVFLDAPTPIILERIAKRGIESERKIRAEYLDSLRERYHRLWARYSQAPVRVLDTSSLDYVNNVRDRETIIELIRGWLDGRNVPGSPASAPAEREDQPTLFP